MDDHAYQIITTTDEATMLKFKHQKYDVRWAEFGEELYEGKVPNGHEKKAVDVRIPTESPHLLEDVVDEAEWQMRPYGGGVA